MQPWVSNVASNQKNQSAAESSEPASQPSAPDLSARFTVAGNVVAAPGIQFALPQNTISGVGAVPFPNLSALPTSQQILVQATQSPYPPPDHVRQYEEILPGVFDRIVTMTERAQAAQIESMNRAMDLEHRDNMVMRILGTLVTLVSIGGAIYLGLKGITAVAIALVGVPVLAIARQLILGHHQQPVSQPHAPQHKQPEATAPPEASS